MISEIIFPSGILKSFINYFWIVEFETSFLEISSPQRIVPNGMIEIFFHYGDKLISEKENIKEKHQNVVIIGQSTNYYDVFQTGKTGFVAVLFKPHAVKLFFDIKLSEITNEIVDLSLFNTEIGNILEKITLSNTISSKIQVIESFLLSRFNDKMLYNYKRLSNCFEHINIATANLKISDLANISCLSDKQFYRIFTEFTGISPKDFIKIIRVQNALSLMLQGKSKNLFEIAFQCGYFDQSHFIKDFKALTGFTPKEYSEILNIYPNNFLQ